MSDPAERGLVIVFVRGVGQASRSRRRSRLRQINPTGRISLWLAGKSLSKFARLTRPQGRIAIVTCVGWDAVDATASACQVIAGRA